VSGLFRQRGNGEGGESVELPLTEARAATLPGVDLNRSSDLGESMSRQ
jgi:hypothetical protein